MKIDENPTDIRRIQEKRHKKGPPQEQNRCRRLAISTKKKQIPSDIRRILKTNQKEQKESLARTEKAKSRILDTFIRFRARGPESLIRSSLFEGARIAAVLQGGRAQGAIIHCKTEAILTRAIAKPKSKTKMPATNFFPLR